MAVTVGDWVYVAASLIGEDSDHAMVRRNVSATQNRSFKVERSDGTESSLISTGYAHADVGVFVITVGDFDTEEATLKPLSKSVLQYLRLLLPDDMVRAVFVRGKPELVKAWTTYAAAYTHVVVIGHSNGAGLVFGAESAHVPAADLASIVAGTKREYLFLACKSGRAAFGRPFSEGTGCGSLVAPFNSLHAAVAAQYAGLYFGERFLGGRTEKAAFNAVREVSTLATARYRFWKDGQFEGQ